ncbi:alpha/beta hydrolase [Mycolicibacterium boenickei]|uniref:Alpha/beta hydrolase n=1 Tax=Mycolicibacterium boenickei TaxID=146017 RepID=A0AAX2ZRE6_9MYCO|nr:alpha/beta hydrolase [Mycolicibacterium boenickei]PEG58555.1 alpha/beta hydrolase [Mycolicibacterium boenickei]UNB97472.1 alpha/beta hydrolase [Mycolicibacterium boenickei]BBX93170.1 putative lipase/esterase [Mycolicibacterium boenickei]
MKVDPEIAALLPVLNTGFPAVETMSGAEARAAVRSRYRPPQQPQPIGSVEDLVIPGDIPVRIYRPATDLTGPLPIVVYAHGGGFVFCDLDTHDDLCRSLSNGVGAMVVSVDYRLAPESRWPAAADDVYAALCWVARRADELGGDVSKIVVAGDSAGGNLAAVTAILARDRGGPEIAGQALLYPVIAADFDTESYRRFETGFYNTRAAMVWYWEQYLPDTGDRSHPHASPLHAEVSGLPPAVVVTAGFDPLQSEGEVYAETLAAQGVPVVHRCYPGAIHGFMTMPGLTLADAARRQVCADIRAILDRDG